MTSPVSHFIPSTKGKTFAVEVLTEVEVGAILGQCSRRAPSGIRNRAMFVVMYRSGLRLQELLDLHVRDIDLDRCRINVRRGKGSKQRVVGIDSQAADTVQNWLHAREKLGLNGSGVLFCAISKGKVGQPLDQSYVRHSLKRAAVKAGIVKRVHPHGLRHSMASELAGELVPIHVIAAQLGHVSVATTDRYIRKIAPHELVNVMKSREWAAS